MNQDKSAIMQIVPSQRNKQLGGNRLFSIPKVSSYKYLGIEIDQDLKFTEELKRRKQIKKDLKKKQWIFMSAKLNDQARYEVWQSLFRSKASYAAEILCYESKPFNKWLKSYNYDGLRQLAKFKGKPNKEVLLKNAVGHNWDCWLNDKLMKTRNKLNLSKEVKPLCDC